MDGYVRVSETAFRILRVYSKNPIYPHTLEQTILKSLKNTISL